MNKTIDTEEIQYCTSCGAANKKSATECVSCGKKIKLRHRPFMDFLKRHIKSKLIDKTTDSIYSYIKNFLLSHLYGAVLSITVVSTVAAVVYANRSPSYIKEVSVSPAVVESEEISADVPENILQQTEVTDEDIDYAWHIVTEYDSFVDNYRDSERYYTAGSEYYDSPDELYADKCIEGYTYPAVHEMISNPISIGKIFYESADSSIYEDRYIDEKTIVSGRDVTTDLGKRLYADGYDVMEYDYVLATEVGEYDYENRPDTSIERLVYKFVLVKSQDKWYIAEDRLVERVGC